jgi:trk system potassium uptake protein
MRVVFVGASSLAVMAAHILLHRGHEVVIIERDKAVIDALAEELDCGFLLGDGAKPALLREADPADTGILFCLTGNDQTNILASLVGRSLGFPRVVTRIEGEEFEHVCIELGLEDTIVPARAIGRHLADMVDGQSVLELSSMIKGEARVLSFAVRAEDEGTIADLQLPVTARVICVYRGDEFLLGDPDTKLRQGDEVVLITHRQGLAPLAERWGIPHPERLR